MNPFFNQVAFDFVNWVDFTQAGNEDKTAIGVALLRYDAGLGKEFFDNNPEETIKGIASTMSQLLVSNVGDAKAYEISASGYTRQYVKAEQIAKGTGNQYLWKVNSTETNPAEIAFGTLATGQTIGGCVWYARHDNAGAPATDIVNPANDGFHKPFKIEFFSTQEGTADGPVKLTLPTARDLVYGYQP